MLAGNGGDVQAETLEYNKGLIILLTERGYR